MVFAADVVCPLTIMLVIGVVWFGGWIGWIRHTRQRAEREATEPDPSGGDTSSVGERPEEPTRSRG